MIIGKSRVISTSKIRKIIAIKKNWSENGIRADDFGSNPHSNGDLFSRSVIFFLEIMLTKIIIIILTVIEIIADVIMIIIIYTIN